MRDPLSISDRKHVWFTFLKTTVFVRDFFPFFTFLRYLRRRFYQTSFFFNKKHQQYES